MLKNMFFKTYLPIFIYRPNTKGGRHENIKKDRGDIIITDRT